MFLCLGRSYIGLDGGGRGGDGGGYPFNFFFEANLKLLADEKGKT